MELITIYHNPRCSKSRQTLALLQKSGHSIEVVEYLKQPINLDILSRAFDSLGMQLVRTKEAEFKSLDSYILNKEEVVELLTQFPKLIERPLVVKNNDILIARPPEKVLEIL